MWNDGRSWEFIAAALPGRSEGTILQRRFSLFLLPFICNGYNQFEWCPVLAATFEPTMTEKGKKAPKK
jgi:hypothetical protein